MNKYTLTALSLTGGILSALAWTSWCSGVILLVSFVPFFVTADYLYQNRDRFTSNASFIYLLPGFVIFSILTLGWMRVASVTGAVVVIMGLSFLMAFSFWLAHQVRVRTVNAFGQLPLVVFWLCYEFLSLNVNIISPWLNLGNGLAKDILLIQWYEYTGTSGGTLWILLSNLLLSGYILRAIKGSGKHGMYLAGWIVVLILPIVFSVIRYNTFRESELPASEVVIVQPNIDPYTEKYTIPFTKQLETAISLAERDISEKTDWVIMPETTIDDPVSLDSLKTNRYISAIRRFASRYPDDAVVAGMVTCRTYEPSKEAPTGSARRTRTDGAWHDYYNSALRIGSGTDVEYYHKSKLVPGIEMQFSGTLGRFAARIPPYLGGTKWGYGIQDERSCLGHPRLSYKVGAVICYESVFGRYVTGWVRNGAGALFIITNDGWWKGTTGYRQHLWYASLRAIETRRPVARAANTGVSCIIDSRGRRISETAWWTRAVLKGNIVPGVELTPYVRYGDIILEISAVAGAIAVIIAFVLIPVIKKIRAGSGKVQP